MNSYKLEDFPEKGLTTEMVSFTTQLISSIEDPTIDVLTRMLNELGKEGFRVHQIEGYNTLFNNEDGVTWNRIDMGRIVEHDDYYMYELFPMKTNPQEVWDEKRKELMDRKRINKLRELMPLDSPDHKEWIIYIYEHKVENGRFIDNNSTTADMYNSISM